MKVAPSCPILCDPMDSTVHGILQAWSGEPFPSPGNLPNPEIEFGSPAFQADSLPAKPQGKPKNTGVGNLSLLQGIFQTPESNQGLLHCSLILYQLSYEGSPGKVFWTIKIALKVSVHTHQFIFFFLICILFPFFLFPETNWIIYLFAFFLNDYLLDLIWSWAFPGTLVMLSRVWLFVTPGTIAHQAPLSTEYSRQEYGNGLSFPAPRDLPNPRIEPCILYISCIGNKF